MSWPSAPFEELFREPSRNGVYKPAAFHGTGIKIVNMGELFAHDVISDQPMERLELTASEFERFSLAEGDLLFGRRSLVEAGAGKCSIVGKLTEPTTFESSIIRVRLRDDRVRPRFAYYWLKSPEGVGRIRAIVNGTNVKGIKGSVLKTVCVAFPATEVQDSITTWLQAYDDLIDNNSRRSTLLEDAARQIYCEWFVRLRFPGREHAHVKDRMPKGWKPTTFGDLCDEIRESVSPETMEPDTPYIGLEHIPRRSISLSEWGSVEEVTSNKHRYRESDILFGKIRPYFHKVGIAFTDGVASSDAIVIRPKDTKLLPLVLTTASSDPFVATTSQTMREGSKMPRADWKQMQAYPTPTPPDGLLQSFNDFINPILAQLKTLALMNRRLKAARDLLLPRLMSGEVAV